MLSKIGRHSLLMQLSNIFVRLHIKSVFTLNMSVNFMRSFENCMNPRSWGGVGGEMIIELWHLVLQIYLAKICNVYCLLNWICIPFPSQSLCVCASYWWRIAVITWILCNMAMEISELHQSSARKNSKGKCFSIYSPVLYVLYSFMETQEPF